MPFTTSLRRVLPPSGGRPGELHIDVRHRGAYTRGSRLNINGLKTTEFSYGDLRLEMLELFPATMLADGLTLLPKAQKVRCGPITACVISGGKALVTVATGHVLTDGEVVDIRQVLGSTEINGRFVTRFVSPTQFTIPAVTAITTFSASANSIVEVKRPHSVISVTGGTTAGVFTSSAAHGLRIGDEITMDSDGGLTGETYTATSNVIAVVTSVPSTTTFKVKNKVTGTPLTFTGGSFSGTVNTYLRRSTRNFVTLALVQPRVVTVTSITAATPAVFTTHIASGLQVGDLVRVDGALDSTMGAAVNKVAVVRTTPSATTFTLEDTAGAPIAGAGTHTANTGLVSARTEIIDASTIEAEGIIVVPFLPKVNSVPFVGPYSF